MYKLINECRICASSKLKSVLNLGNQALTGIFPKDSIVEVPSGPLALIKCGTCGLVQLNANYDLSLLYGSNYGYRSGLNASMVKHLNEMVKRIEGIVELSDDDIVVDIGSNDSTLLQGYSNTKLERVGVDPSGGKFRQFYPENVRLIEEFFPSKTFIADYAGVKPKVITSIAMFYDLEQPQEFVRTIQEFLHPEGVWVFEQSYLPFMLEKNSFDTVCHEHLEYYSVRQVKQLLDNCHMKVIDLSYNDVNGGSFAVMAAHKTSKYAEATELVAQALEYEALIGLDGDEVFSSFQKRIEEQKANLLNFLTEAKEAGKKVVGYGASTKGNVLIQYYGITPELLPCIAEVNPDKFGAYTPGSKVSIIPEQEARAMNPDYFIVFPWHFRDFIIQKEHDYINSGGSLVFPLPEFVVIDRDQAFKEAEASSAYSGAN